ncbi:MAG: alcohol dehydrogenase catalytic domain-containing protein [Pseudomonadota bacterium]
MPIEAAYYTGNRTFSVESVSEPRPGPGEVQMDTAYCGICGTDLHIYLGDLDQRVGARRVIGHEMSGVISELGDGVSGWSIGDRVVMRPLVPCGRCPACERGYQHVCQNLQVVGVDLDGAFQNRCVVPAYTLHRLPDAVSLEHAALIEPVAVACHDIKRGRLVAGEDALVIGGGPIGILVALVAKAAGATVTVSEINPHRIAIAEKLGIACLNPKEVDVAQSIVSATGGKGADVVFEVSGTQPGADLMTQAAAVRGRIVMVAIYAGKAQVDLHRFFAAEIEMLGARVYEPDDYERAIELVASGGIDADTFITDVQPLANISDAFADLTGSPKGMKTLIRCGMVD